MNQCEPWLCHKHAWSTLVWWTETSSLESWTVVTQVTDTAILTEVVEHSTVGILSDQTLSQAEGESELMSCSRWAFPFLASHWSMPGWHCLLIPDAVTYSHSFSRMKDFWEHALWKTKQKTYTNQRTKKTTRKQSTHNALWSLSFSSSSLLKYK